MNGQQHLPEEPVRSKGQATLLPEGSKELSATIRDLSVSAIGVIAPSGVSPGTRVCIDTHGHTAQGVVRSCQPVGNGFHIAIALDPAAA